MLAQDPLRRGSHTPDNLRSSDRKRRRKTLSCYDCRRRKLRCDREYPFCSRCRKAGQPESCSYEVGTQDLKEHDEADKSEGEPCLQRGETSDHIPSVQQIAWPTSALNTHLPNDPSTQLVLQSRRIAQLERRLASLEGPQPAATWQSFGEVHVASGDKATDSRNAKDMESFLTTPQDLLPPRYAETILFRGKNYKTQYYGGTNPTSLIAHVRRICSLRGSSTKSMQFPELRVFMKEAMTHHTSLPHVQRDLKSLQVKWKSAKADDQAAKDFNFHELLPRREIIDPLVHTYFNNFETLYRILHAPTFWKEYESFWQDPQVARPAFIVIILLVMATVNASSKEQSTYIGDSATAREMALLWIEACDLWVQRQSQKHTYLALFQIQCLLLLSKQANSVKKKRSWTSAGTLIRYAMSAGFHRDPKLLGRKISVFDQEMRRRLWATMVELELQASIDRGMPSATAGMKFPCDSAPALNVNDEDFDENSQVPPMQQSEDAYTATSFLHLSRSSLSLRVFLNSVLNELSSHPKYEDVLKYDEMIMHKLRELPSQTKSSDASMFQSLPGTLLDIQLRQFLILLHNPFARQAESSSRYSLSKMTCFNAASSIIAQHSRLTNSGNYTLCLFRNDVFRSALAVCHTIYVSSTIQSGSFSTKCA